MNYRYKTTIAMLRETYSVWERRAPLAPIHVKALLEKHSNTDQLQVLVQPSKTRIFTNAEYEQAGAVVTEDISKAGLVLSVKRPLASRSIPSHCTAIFFSHLIKGQAENLELLQDCMNRQIQLLDWECVKNDALPQPKRLVSFGRYAGLAGAIDSLHGLGRKLLHSHELATPLLHVPPTFMHESLDAAKECVRKIGSELASSTNILDRPLVIAVTGKGGCVHNGAMEILSLLPHDLISVDDLPHHATENKVYLVPVGLSDVFQKTNGEAFDRQDFSLHPELYRCTFHRKVAPFCEAIVNAVYWDARFPRLLTKQQMRRLAEQKHSGASRLLFVGDITCDVNGSIEFLEKTTAIEQPFFEYDPIQQRVIKDEISANGIAVMGVSILPTELPLDSTLHFGESAMTVVSEIVHARHVQGENVAGVDSALLRKGLATACITTASGQLEHRYRYLESFLRQSPLALDQNKLTSILVSLRGHLFDSGLINQVLDVIERHGISLVVEQLSICQPTNDGTSSKSSVLLKLMASDVATLDLVYAKLRALARAVEPAAAALTIIDHHDAINGVSKQTTTVTEQAQCKRVLILGAGHVSKSVVEYLGRSEHVCVTVASEKEADALEASKLAKNGRHMAVDVANNVRLVSELIEDSDLVISLLPAPMHTRIAEECIFHQAAMVTASYESDEMRTKGKRAAAAGVVILNEVGLDPGLDHMSAMKIIDDIKGRGGTLTLFSSVCGGLPSPEAADNPFRYKFSWSPRGVIRASLNSAKYRAENRVVEITGWELLQSAVPFTESFADLDLEVIPNRDSLSYENVYGIGDVPSIFRGTLRYKGFSRLVNTMKNVGLFSENVTALTSWTSVIAQLRNERGGFDSLEDFLLACADEDVGEATRAMAALNWLGMLHGDASFGPEASIVDAFCGKLEQQMMFKAGESDMVVMHHTIDALFEDGHRERHKSSLRLLGDPKQSAMAKTVGYTTAASANLILAGHFQDKCGLLLPTDCTVYEPVLFALAKEGVVFEERILVH
ncbi:hypothetical protein MPSEU_000342200 [Mayamaea pseudoterrestris]|nr:hypothetical protein MPSEU_000342200 [Mayamaea pseudoterrestris]